ncbi:MAG: secondary thiamine-phosphate synthase enzyme YjbQ [Candidatus Thorarchaeota archaeon]
MVVYQTEIQLNRTTETEIVNITPELERVVSQAGVRNGTLNTFIAGATGAIIALEFEPGLLKDIPALLERITPKKHHYFHEQTWHDDNGHSHVRASLLGPSLTVPIKDGRVVHGTWQQIAFVELDTRQRNRSLFITVIGE